MFGRPDAEDRAQLALMDALVFFAGAILISSMILSYSTMDASWTRSYDDSVYPASVLDAVLKSSIGANVTVAAIPPFLVPRFAPVRDCLAIEANSLYEGMDTQAFEGMNEMIMRTLEACAPPMSEPHMFIISSSYSEPLLALPHATGSENQGEASSATLVSDGDRQLMVVLVLCPASPPELVHV